MHVYLKSNLKAYRKEGGYRRTVVVNLIPTFGLFGS